MKSTNVYATDGVAISSIDYEVSNKTKGDILHALTAIKGVPTILSCAIDGSEIWATAKLFDSTIDDNERKEIKGDDLEDFTSDIQHIIIKKSGVLVFKAYSKYSDDFLTFTLE